MYVCCSTFNGYMFHRVEKYRYSRVLTHLVCKPKTQYNHALSDGVVVVIMFTALLTTGLDIETVYLVNYKHGHQLFSDSDLVFIWRPFWYFSLICCLGHKDSHRDFILLIATLLAHKRNKVTNLFSEIV